MTDPTLPRADEVLKKAHSVWQLRRDQGEWPALNAVEVDALFACLPPGSEYVVIRRSDLAVMGLEPLGVDDSTRDLARSLGAEPGYRLVAPGSPTVPENETEASDG